MEKRITYLLLTVLFVTLLSSVVLAQQPISQEELTEIEDMIQKNMERFQVPGTSFVMVTVDDVIINKGYGVRELGTDKEVNADTIMGLASVSKAFTSLGIIKLRDSDMLELTDPVIKHLPWFKTKNKEMSDKIRIIDLMRHTSGFPTQAYGLEIEDGTSDDLEEQIKRVTEIKLIAEPGESFRYSNFNYWTLALIIEKVSGREFSDFMKANLFETMEMDRTGYYQKISELDNVAQGHKVRYAKPNILDYHLPGQTNAAGGLYSTANDMGNYLMTLLDKGFYNNTYILSENSIGDSWYNTHVFNEENGYGYGWFQHKVDGQMIIEHGGDNPNFTAHVYILPRKKLAFALMSNSQHPMTHRVAGNITNLILKRPLNEINGTAFEGNASLARQLNYVAIALGVIMLIWLIIVIRKVRQSEYIIFRKPGTIRLILQGVLVPIIGIVAIYFVQDIPKQAIGSIRLAMLYQGDLVASLIRTGITFMVFTFFTGFMAFVGKPENPDQDLSA